MILEHYKLAEQPFGVTPDPKYMYLSATHREAMASVLYGVTVNRGFSALIARPGMGKTTILFDLLGRLKSTERTVFLFQTRCGPRGLLRALLADLGIEDDGRDLVRMNAKLNEFLLRESANGRRLVVIIDEAQNLSEPVLEVVRMLSNFETIREKLMHVILSGQPQLAEKLSGANLVQLRQRISIVARLEPFNMEETRNYINHRLSTSGYDMSSVLFTDKAIALIARHSEGIPRTINNLCFNAMSLGTGMKRRKIDEGMILEVLNDLDFRQFSDREKVEVQAEEIEPSQLMPPAVVMASAPPEERRWKLAKWVRRAAVAVGTVGLLIWPTMRATVYAKKVLSGHTETRAASALPAEPTRTNAGQKGNSSETKVAENVRAIEARPEPTAPAPAPSEAGGSEGEEKVRVKANETLFRISMKHYGKYDATLTREIVSRNPEVRNPSRIKSGQILRLPVVRKPSRDAIEEWSNVRNSFAGEVK